MAFEEYFYNVIIVLLVAVIAHEAGHYIALKIIKKDFVYDFNWKMFMPTFKGDYFLLSEALVIYYMGIFCGLFVILLMSQGVYVYLNLFAYLIGCHYDLKGIYKIIKIWWNYGDKTKR